MRNRDILTLLKVLRDNIGLLKFGFCWLCHQLYVTDVINEKEFLLLTDYLNNNKPKNTNTSYWFSNGSVAPRLDWLNEQIAKEEKKPLNRLKSLCRWFLHGSDNNPIPGWAFAVVFVVIVATVYMLVDTVIDLVVYYNF
jgi:hypothetical protein